MLDYIEFSLSTVNGKPAVWQAHYVRTTGRMAGHEITAAARTHDRATFFLSEGVYRVRYDDGTPAWLVIAASASGYEVRKVGDEQAYRIVEMWLPTSAYVAPVTLATALAIAS